ncbi:alpha/beta fold hydrolase [Streptomyces sp. NPDC092296]|uniref:alpha/beta fold hydrolase n=1 Tax=Streptomyces sp. NPDC092296 TaxID=3366012 RepID=UPI00380C234E
MRGTGPLLLIAGGVGDAGVSDGVAARLADRFTVAAHHPRGNSRSRLAGPPVDQRVAVHRDDVHRLLELPAPPGDPAYVLGSRSGALVARCGPPARRGWRRPGARFRPPAAVPAGHAAGAVAGHPGRPVPGRAGRLCRAPGRVRRAAGGDGDRR